MRYWMLAFCLGWVLPGRAQYATGFDDWPIIAEGDWEQVRPEGTYRSFGCYCNFGNTLSGLRKIGFNQVGDRFELPPVSFPDQVRFQARTSTGGAAALTVQYRSGADWQDAGICPVTDESYQPCVVDLSALSGEVGLRIVMTAFGNSVFLDDLEVSNAFLPVELTAFSARVGDRGAVRLDWETATETDNDYFGVERSRDGSRFVEVGRVSGAGRSTAVSRYRFSDRPPEGGPWHYRLRQVDHEGSFRYSDIVAVRVPAEARGFRVFPSVAGERLWLELLPADTERRAVVVDAQGRGVREAALPPLTSRAELNVGALPPGQYFLKLSGPRGGETAVFFKR